MVTHCESPGRCRVTAHMPSLLSRTALALAAAGALACSTRERITGPDVGAIPIDPGTFLLRTDGLASDEITGGAAFALLPSDLAGPRCHLVLEAGGSNPATLRIWIGSELRPRLRTYLWGVDPVPFDRFTATLLVPSGGQAGPSEYVATGGTLRITNNSATEVAGEFVIDAEVPSIGGASAIALEGAFRAAPDASAGVCRDPDS
jgi:hypothetical protein